MTARLARSALVALAAGLMLAACGSDEPSTSPSPTTEPEDVQAELQAERCLIWLHGRSDRGHAAREEDGFTILAPDANEEYERDGRVWVYDDEDTFAEAQAIVADTVDRAGCEVVAVHGFSNGAAFAGALACSGETFDGRLRGVIIDDPVPDEGTEDCTLGDGVEVALYWTGGLTQAEPGASCADIDWTCRGTHLIGIEAYADNLGVDISESPHRDHKAHYEAPERQRWLLEGAD